MTTRREGPGWEDSDEGLLAQAEYADAAQQGTNWEAEAARLRRLLEDLTPGGSEFHNDPDYCARHIRVRSGLLPCRAATLRTL